MFLTLSFDKYINLNFLSLVSPSFNLNVLFSYVGIHCTHYTVLLQLKVRRCTAACCSLPGATLVLVWLWRERSSGCLRSQHVAGRGEEREIRRNEGSSSIPLSWAFCSSFTIFATYLSGRQKSTRAQVLKCISASTSPFLSLFFLPVVWVSVGGAGFIVFSTKNLSLLKATHALFLFNRFMNQYLALGWTGLDGNPSFELLNVKCFLEKTLFSCYRM